MTNDKGLQMTRVVVVTTSLNTISVYMVLRAHSGIGIGVPTSVRPSLPFVLEYIGIEVPWVYREFSG